MSFPIKIAFNGELRRFMSPSAPSYVDVVAAVQQMFPRLSATGFSLKYEDEENELITVASEAELAEALAVCEHLERKTLKLIVVTREEDWVSVPQGEERDEQKEEEKPEPENQPEPEKEPQPELEKEIEVKVPEKNEPEKEKEEPLPTKDEIVAVLVELVSDVRVQAELPKLVETALSDVSLDALLDPSLPTVELLRNILSSVPEIAAHPSAGRLLAAAANVKAGEAMAQLRERLATTIVPLLRSLRPMLLTTLPLMIQQLPALIQSLVDRVSSAYQSGDPYSMPSVLGAFPFFAPFAASFGMPEYSNQTPDQGEEAQSASARAEEEPVHRGVTCDGCGASPIAGVRFKCTVCPNFDLCKTCEAKGQHAPSHPLLQLRAPAVAEAVHDNIQCNACGVVPIHGPRFKCTVCPNFDLCDACEQKGQHEHPMLKLRQAESRPHGRGSRHWHRQGGHRPHGPHGFRHWSHQSGDDNGARQQQCGAGGFPGFGAFQGFGPFGGAGAFGRMFGHQNAPRSSWSAVFVSDVTLPDGCEVMVGSEMVKTWKLRNDGQQAWPQGTALVLKRSRGEFHTAPLQLSRLPNPGEEVEVSATITALQPGRGSVCYRIVDNTGVPFGVKLWADVMAVAPPKEPEPEPEPVKAQETPKEQSQPPHRYASQLAMLSCMGFDNRELNIGILDQEKGNVERTVSRLLEM